MHLVPWVKWSLGIRMFDRSTGEEAVGSSTPELLNFSYERTENVYEKKGQGQKVKELRSWAVAKGVVMEVGCRKSDKVSPTPALHSLEQALQARRVRLAGNPSLRDDGRNVTVRRHIKSRMARAN